MVFLSELPLRAQLPGGVPSDSSLISISQVWTSLPDFVCKERIVSSRVEKGKTKERRIVESVFTAQRKEQTRDDGVKVYSLVESREPNSIDGKPVPKTVKMPTAPLFFDGLAANILFLADGPRYSSSRVAPVDGRLSIRIGFTTGRSNEFTQLEFPAAVSNVQIDTQSRKTLHVENRLSSLRGGSSVPISADFQSIDIDGNTYWVPRVVQAEADMGKDGTASYTAEYVDCKKFEVRVEIRALPNTAPDK